MLGSLDKLHDPTLSVLELERRKKRSHNPDNLDPESCLVLMSWDPLGKTGGAPEATTCDRGFGLYPSLKNLPSPYSYQLDFVNTCEKYCLQRPECEFYVYDCKLSLCELKMGRVDEKSFVNNTRYITGKKSSRKPGECQNETTAGFPVKTSKIPFSAGGLTTITPTRETTTVATTTGSAATITDSKMGTEILHIANIIDGRFTLS